MEVVIGPTMAGLSVAAMPAGFSDHGLPMGIQIIGRPQGRPRGAGNGDGL